jgi:hypothetical protein
VEELREVSYKKPGDLYAIKKGRAATHEHAPGHRGGGRGPPLGRILHIRLEPILKL